MEVMGILLEKVPCMTIYGNGGHISRKSAIWPDGSGGHITRKSVMEVMGILLERVPYGQMEVVGILLEIHYSLVHVITLHVIA